MHHHNGVTDQPHGPTQQQKKQLVDLLVAAELQQYRTSLNNQLNVGTVRQLKAVSDDDLVTVIGMSKPEVRRLRKFVKKMAGQSGTLEKIKNILSKSTHDTTDLCCLPVTDRSPTSFLIDQSDITISKELGRGSFGSVHSGTWITSSGSKLPIAARKIPLMTSERARDHFLSSAQSIHLLKHANVVRLFGVTMTTSHFLMVVEQAPGGQSLKTWLQSGRSPPTNLNQLLIFIRQTLSASTFMESCKFVHGDLAARNVLVFSDDLVKVADPGLRSSLDWKDNSLKDLVDGNDERIGWLAPECLESPRFSSLSTSSDVWSFGVTMWEMFSVGGLPPWCAYGSHKLLSAIKSGEVLDQPLACPRDFYSLMCDCLRTVPHERPPFHQVENRLNKINVVRLQVEVEPVMMTMATAMVGGVENQLQLKIGDVITVLDSSSTGSPLVGWWKGLNESTNQIGFFNPVNMKLFSAPESDKQHVAKQQTGSSNVLRKAKAGQQKPRLTAGMISLPLNDLRHTSHVGRNGDTFGCEMIPIQQVNTSADQTSERSDTMIGSAVNIAETKPKREGPPPVPSQKPPVGQSERTLVNGRLKEASPTSCSGSKDQISNLASKLSVGSNISGDVLTRVKYSPSSLSMVSADLSHVTSLMSSDTLTDVSSLPGDIGSLSKSDYEDYDCMDDDTFDVSTVEEGDGGTTPYHDDTMVCATDDDDDGGGGGDGDDDDHGEDDDDSPQTIEEPRTPKILDTSSSLFDEVMFALGGTQQTIKPIQNGRRSKSKKRATFDVGDSDELDYEPVKIAQNQRPKIAKDYREIKTLPKLPSMMKYSPDEKHSTVTARIGTPVHEADNHHQDDQIARIPNGRQHQSCMNVCDSSFTTSSTISLMSSCSDLKSSNSSLFSEAAVVPQGRVSVLSKISNALARPKSKDQRRFSQASTTSRLSIALANIAGELDNSNSKLSSSSFSGFDVRKTKVIPLDGLHFQKDKYPSFLPSKPRSLKNSKAKDKLRRSSLILASVFQTRRDDRNKRPTALPTSNFNTNELFFNKLREQERELADRAEENLKRLKEEEGESEDSGVAFQSLNQSQEAMPSSSNFSRDISNANSSPKTSPDQEIDENLDDDEMNTMFAFSESDDKSVLDLSEIFLKMDMPREEVSVKSCKYSTQNGRLSNDSVGHQKGQHLTNGSQQSTRSTQHSRTQALDRPPIQQNSGMQIFPISYTVEKEDDDDDDDGDDDDDVDGPQSNTKGDSFLPKRPTLVRTCSSGSESPDVVDV